MKQVKNFIKTLFCGLSDDEMNDNVDTLWSEYTDFNHNNGHFYGDYFIWRSEDTQE